MRAFHIIVVLLALAGCTAVAGAPAVVPPLAGVEGLSVLGTDKTITDHFISFSTGKNCSTIRKNLGMTYCEEDEVGTVDEVYCYRSLGRVNCFAVPAPHGERQPTVGHIPSAAPPPR
ncbi:MAG: hypothetical protein QF393_02385 [Rhodospirillales bacterium]|nr:hypothetical protein [Rhodospirillales bacterium]MDP6643428.1 hypothetical protein [Rhodospirillales bacterium]